jgi:hypothetical protein
MPDLVCHLLPGLAAAGPGDYDNPAATDPSFSSGSEPKTEFERETAYIFRPVALKKVAHYPGGASGGANACRPLFSPPPWR